MYVCVHMCVCMGLFYACMHACMCCACMWYVHIWMHGCVCVGAGHEKSSPWISDFSLWSSCSFPFITSQIFTKAKIYAIQNSLANGFCFWILELLKLPKLKYYSNFPLWHKTEWKIHKTHIKQYEQRGWREGTEVTSQCRSWQVQVLAPTRLLTIICNSRFRESYALFWSQWALHTHMWGTYIHTYTHKLMWTLMHTKNEQNIWEINVKIF